MSLLSPQIIPVVAADELRLLSIADFSIRDQASTKKAFRFSSIRLFILIPFLTYGRSIFTPDDRKNNDVGGPIDIKKQVVLNQLSLSFYLSP